MRKSQLWAGILLVFSLMASTAQEALRAQRDASGRLQLSWPGRSLSPDGSARRPYFEVDRSEDLHHWEPFGERMRAPEGTDLLRLELQDPGSLRFFRLRQFEPRLNQLASDSASVFGYAEALETEQERIGQISLTEFQQMFSLTNQYLENLTWDPATARFWSDFNADPKVANQGKPQGSLGYRYTDFRLNPAEMSVFVTNGFVVSERLGASSHFFNPDGDSFSDLFYKVWFDDLPVFVSTDAILQAWHRTYSGMLAEVEETFLMGALDAMLSAMSARLPELWAEAGEGPLRESIQDVDLFLAVARSLLSTNRVSSPLGQDAEVWEMLARIRAFRMVEMELFGACRRIDFSQFIPRGHYTHSARLTRYFQSSTWLGRTDFMVAGGMVERCLGDARPVSPRETGGALVIWDLLHRAGQFERWQQVDRVIESFVGWSDSLGVAQLGGILAGAGLRSVRDVTSIQALEELQQAILGGELGAQNIRSDYFVSPRGPEQMQLPRAFLFLGQRFTPDSWALSQTVFDSILWNDVKVNRRVPSALDVAFSVFGNDHVVPLLAGRIANTNAFNSTIHAERWRDGLPYQHQLAALRQVLDTQEPAGWESNIYVSWLHALRQLSLPTTSPAYPEAMRTRAWAMKTLNTQLASWTHLRHDNVLYVKQSYTGGAVCFYPHGFVEPRVEFWDSLGAMITRAADLIGQLDFQGDYTYAQLHTVRSNFFLVSTWTTNTVPMSVVRSNQTAHLHRFASVVRTLSDLSRKELAQIAFSEEDDAFIKALIQDAGTLPLGSGGVRKYDGWFPRLFYRPLPYIAMSEVDFQEHYGANAGDRVVVDVHTDVAAPGDPGGVLHQGIGTPNLLLIAVDNGPDRMVYAGPVLSHYEFEVVGEPYRMTDMEWDGLITAGPGSGSSQKIEGLHPPSWTRGYLVPKAAP